jgi:hypothetical protein
VPRGAEARAVRRGARGARVVEIPAGPAAASALPAFDAGETVIVLGLCGALRRLRAGDPVYERLFADVAVYARVAGDAGTFALDAGLVDVLAAALPGALVVQACTSNRVVTKVAARAALARRFGADVVDMEGARLAAALDAGGVRYAMVRVVSDDASHDLPPLDDVIDAQGQLRLSRVAVAFARAPFDVFSFAYGVRRALNELTQTARTVAHLGL